MGHAPAIPGIYNYFVPYAFMILMLVFCRKYIPSTIYRVLHKRFRKCVFHFTLEAFRHRHWMNKAEMKLLQLKYLKYGFFCVRYGILRVRVVAAANKSTSSNHKHYFVRKINFPYSLFFSKLYKDIYL